MRHFTESSTKNALRDSISCFDYIPPNKQLSIVTIQQYSNPFRTSTNYQKNSYCHILDNKKIPTFVTNIIN